MKRLSILVAFLLLLSLFPMTVFAEGDDVHTVNVTWLFDKDMDCPTEPPFEGTKVIGSTSFTATEGEIVDVSRLLYHPAGAGYIQEGFINYNGTPCFIEFTYGAGGKGINSQGEPIDGLPFDFDPFSDLTMPGTDVDLYYVYAPYRPHSEPENQLDKIVIYVNRPNGDVNSVRQTYEAYEIFHVSKTDDVQEDVTNDYTVGQPMPENIGFVYWISEDDPWFDVVNEAPYFVLTDNGDGTYDIVLNTDYPSTEDTAIEIAHYLESHIPEGVEPKVVTADKASYDNDPGYYLIVSEINSNLILGTTNIAITEKAEYPTIEKEVDDAEVQIGQVVTFTITTHFPRGSKATSIFTDTMDQGLTYIPGSIETSVEYEVEETDDGWVMVVAQSEITSLFKDEEGDIVITYQALVNKDAEIEKNKIRLDFSNYSVEDFVEVSTTSITLLKYDVGDEDKNPLPGAEFALIGENEDTIKLVKVEDSVYRPAESDEEESMNSFITEDSEITINGLAADKTYFFREISAPTGYNPLSGTVQIEGSRIEIGNSSGTVLPSTGGRGVLIFSIGGGMLVVIAGLLLLFRRVKI